MMDKKLDASCHCASIRLTINLEKPLSEIVRCNCSICSKSKGFGMVCVHQENVTVVEAFKKALFNNSPTIIVVKENYGWLD